MAVSQDKRIPGAAGNPRKFYDRMTTPLNCPLCGEPPLIEDRNLPLKGDYVICTHRCTGEVNYYVEMSDDFKSKAKAIETWNEWVEGMRK